MATGHGAEGMTVTSTQSSDTIHNHPNHLRANIESGGFEDKSEKQSQATRKDVDDDEEDIDALIEDLESLDGHEQEADDEEDVVAGGERVIPEEFLNTSTQTGLTEEEVQQRRKKYGRNEMAEARENLFLKFCMYFVGPIQFVMEVRYPFCFLLLVDANKSRDRPLLFSL